jgi:hypothetical protein
MEVACSLVTIHNPTKRPRVIWDGIKNENPIRLDADETKENVTLADFMIERLNQRKDDLVLSNVSPDLPAQVQAKKPVVEDVDITNALRDERGKRR